MQDIIGLGLEELKGALKILGFPGFHAQQIFSWVYKRKVRDFERMSDLPQGLRKRLKEKFCLSRIKLLKCLKSEDGTEKFLIKLYDDNVIEAVIIPAPTRATACISTQVGCKYACKFCASGLLGFKRNLTCAEIIGQVLCLKKESSQGKLTHIVFMGTGEPLDNYENVLKAIRIINSAQAFNIAARRITISTLGLTPEIKKLSQEGLQIELSVSLHAADDRLRSKIMPINKKYPLKNLVSACYEYIKETNRQITFEYILIKGINSDLQNAIKLSKILRGLNCKVNLIPANPIKEYSIEPPEKITIVKFKGYLSRQGLNVTLRRPRGEDIEAACGQLKLRYEKE